MEIVCVACHQDLGAVESTARLILTVHCAYCGKDFGLAVDPPDVVVEVPAVAKDSAPAKT